MEPSALTFESMGVSLPFNLEAEQAVLGAVLLKSEVIGDLLPILQPEHFYASMNGDIYAQMVQLYNNRGGRSVDFVTVLNAVTGSGIFSSEADAKVYLTGLAETVPSISNVVNYAKIVRDKFMIRELMNAARGILEQSGQEEDADLLLESAEQQIYEIRRGRDPGTLKPIANVLLDTLDTLGKLSGPEREKYLGIPTGFSYLDRVLTGLGRTDLIILAARPGMGKTSFALNIASNIAQRGVPVAFFSLEMTREQLMNRILSAETGIENQKLRTGSLSKEEFASIAEASDRLSKLQFYMDEDSAITVPEIKAKIRRLNQDPAQPDIGLIVIDYLQLMNATKYTDSRVQAVSEITRSLKIMAKELNVPVLCLSQLNRNTERGTGRSHRPVLADLRDSGSIEQDADIVLFLLRTQYYEDDQSEEPANPNEAECIVAKNRHGETRSIKMSWDGAHTRFLEIDYAEEDE